MRYYLDPSPPGTNGRTIYDNNDGMPAIVVMPQTGEWTADREAALELILKALNGS